MSVVSALSISASQLSDGSATCQAELEKIFGPSIPYVLDPEQIYFGKEEIFDRQDKHKIEKMKKPADHIEMNAKSDRNPRMIKIKKSTSNKRRKNGINIVKDCKDDIIHAEFSDKDSIQHVIPIEEYAKPIKEKLRSINFKSFCLAQRKLHQTGFKESLIRWLRTRKKGFHQNIKNQGKVQRSFDNSSQPVGRHKAKSASERVTP